MSDRTSRDPVVDRLPIGVAVFDAESVCRSANPAFSSIVSGASRDLVGEKFIDMVSSRFGTDVARSAEKALLDTLASGQLHRFEQWAALDAGEVFVRCEICRLDHASAGTSPRVLVTLYDVTRHVLDRRALEERRHLASSLTRLSTLIGFSMDVDEILREAAMEAGEAMNCDSAIVHVLDSGKWVVQHVHNLPPGLLGESVTLEEIPFANDAVLTGRPVAIDDVLAASGSKAAVRSWPAVRSSLVVPLMTRGEVTGLVFFNYHGKPRPFTKATVDYCARFATIVSLAVDNARLSLADREMTDALQSALIGRMREVPGVQFGHLYRSATRDARVGGDFYEVFKLDENHVGVLIGDVSGKGLEAAALMSIVKNTVKVHAEDLLSPAATLAKTNEVTCRESASDSFVTMFFGVLETETGSLRYCQAGHPPAIVRRRDGHAALLRDECPILGAFEGVTYEERETYLEPGDLLLLYTDGVIEARRDGVQYGELRLAGFVAGLPEIDPMQLPEQVFEEVFVHARGDIADDMAVLALTPTRMAAVAQGRLAI